MFPKIKHKGLEVPDGSDPQDRSPTGPKCPPIDHIAARLVKLALI